MKNHTVGKELNRIEKRAIEALAIAPLIMAVSQRIGWDEALAILQEVNQQEAFQRGRSQAEEMGRNGIEALVMGSNNLGGNRDSHENTHFLSILQRKCMH